MLIHMAKLSRIAVAAMVGVALMAGTYTVARHEPVPREPSEPARILHGPWALSGHV
jgi:hypothetical protein